VLLSRASVEAGVPANGFSSNVALGTSPTVTAWNGISFNLDPDVAGDFLQVYARQLSGSQATVVVSRPSGDEPRASLVNSSFISSFFGTPHAMSDDGRLVVFTSDADGLDPEAAGPSAHVYVRDVLTQELRLVSRAAGPAGIVADGGALGTSAISSDERARDLHGLRDEPGSGRHHAAGLRARPGDGCDRRREPRGRHGRRAGRISRVSKGGRVRGRDARACVLRRAVPRSIRMGRTTYVRDRTPGRRRS
jgi:hypothetical protein